MKKKERKKLSFRRTAANNLFALRAIWEASPSYLIVYFSASVAYGVLDFLSETYLLRKVVNSVESGEDIGSIVTYVSVIGIICFVVYQALRWFWDVMSPPRQRRIAANVEKMLFKQAAKVELACYEMPSFYDKYVRAMDEAYERIMKVMRSFDALIDRFIALFANSLLLFMIDPWLIVFALFPLLLGFLRRLENVAIHDQQSAVKPINRRADYVRRAFYLGEYAKEMRIGGMYLELLHALGDTFTDFKALVKKYGTKRAVLGYIQRIGLEVFTILGATLYAVWSTMCVGPEAGGMQVGDCIVVLSSIGVISYCIRKRAAPNSRPLDF